jgi:hypothetical protein
MLHDVSNFMQLFKPDKVYQVLWCFAHKKHIVAFVSTSTSSFQRPTFHAARKVQSGSERPRGDSKEKLSSPPIFTTFCKKVVTDLPQEGSVILLGRI